MSEKKKERKNENEIEIIFSTATTLTAPEKKGTMPSSLDSRSLMSPSRPTTPASQDELDRELAETAVQRSHRRQNTKALKHFASHLAAFLAGAGALALLLFLLPAPPPSPSSVPEPDSLFFSPSRALDALCEAPTKRLLEARSGRGYFAALDDAASALPPALHASLLFLGACSSSPSPSNCLYSAGSGGHRLVFVGDVHGCADDLAELLRKVGFAKGRDTLVLLGDVVSKGPDSPRALRIARELGALAVRGNHDDAALAAYDFYRKHGGALPKVSRGATGGEDFGFVRNLTEADATFLRELPWTLQIPAVAAVAVHAGLVPGVAVNRQNPSDVFTMRGVVQVSGDGDGGGGGDGQGGSIVVRCWKWLLRTLFHKHEKGSERSKRQEAEKERSRARGALDQGRRGGGGGGGKGEERGRPEEGGGGKERGRSGRRGGGGEVRYRAAAAVGEGVPWAKAWSSFRGQSRHVVFGHDSRSGVQLEAWATGIDSGCVDGGELTALVLPLPPTSTLTSTSAFSNAQEGRWPDRGVELVSVKCRGGGQH